MRRSFSATTSLLALLSSGTFSSCHKETPSYGPLPVSGIDSCEEKTWYEDADGDGYGNAMYILDACVAPTGWVYNDTDCDDRRDSIHPGQAEICNDFLDNDCDETANNCLLTGDISLSSADLILRGHWSDRLGSSVAGVGDMDGNGGNDFAVGAPGAGDSGRVYVVFSPFDKEEISYVTLAGSTPRDSFIGSNAGYALAGADDLNNDGYADLVIGAPFFDTEKWNNIGETYLVLGPVSEDLLLDDADGVWFGEGAEERVGAAVAGVGDVNGDESHDILIGAYAANRTGQRAGAAYLFYGPADKGGSVSSADAILVGEHAYDVAGWSVAGAQDTNGDGLADLLVGAYGHDAGGSLSGAAYLFFDSVEREVSLEEANAKFIGEREGDRAGYSLASGDIDNDGYADCIIGASTESSRGTYAGATYVFHSPIKGELSLSDAHAKVIGEAYNDGSGSAVASAGDVNSDGYDDVLIGAPGAADVEGNRNSGLAYLLYSPFSGTDDLATMPRAKFLGGDFRGRTGKAVAIAPDINNDGFDDLLIGAPAAGIFVWSDGYKTNTSSGAAYIMYGGGI